MSGNEEDGRTPGHDGAAHGFLIAVHLRVDASKSLRANLLVPPVKYIYNCI